VRSYFAYGSNMIVDTMRQRCPTARFEGIARLRDYRFRIVRSGYASLLWEQGAVAYGVLWSVSARDERSLDGYEEIAAGLYHRTHLSVETSAADGKRERRVTALAYLAADPGLGRPRRGYLEPILAAARAHRLPEASLADIARYELS
jgi:hypothetical protein